MKRTVTSIVLILFFIFFVNAQSNQDRAKAYFMQAQSDYDSGSYQKSIENLDKVKELLGASNPMTLSLRYKSYYQLKDYSSAKKYLNLFFRKSGNASKSLKDEATSFIIKIDEALDAEKKRIEKIRLEEIKRKEQERLAEIERKEKERLAEIKRKENARLEEIRKKKEAERLKEEKRVRKAKARYNDDNRESKFRHIGNLFIDKNEYGKFGVINQNANILIDYSYIDYHIFKEQKVFSLKGDKYAYFYNFNGQRIKGFVSRWFEEEINYVDWSNIKDPRPVLDESGNKKGLINYNFQLIVPPIYENIVFERYKALISVKNSNDKWGFYNHDGNLVIPCKYDRVLKSDSFDTYRVELNGKTFYIDANDQIVSSFSNSNFKYNEGLAIATKDGKKGFIDKDKNIVVPIIYDEVYNFKDGVAKVRLNGKEGLINNKGQFIIEAKYRDISNIMTYGEGNPLSSFFFKIEGTGGNYALANLTNGIVTDFKYKVLKAFANTSDLVLAENEDGKYGLLNKDGSEVLALDFFDISPYDAENLNANYFQIFKESFENVGLVNEEGKIMVPPKYKEIRFSRDSKGNIQFIAEQKIREKGIDVYDQNGVLANELLTVGEASNGLVRAIKDNKFGYIGKNNKTKIKFLFTEAEDFNELGIARVKLDGFYGLINKNGRFIVPNEFITIGDFSQELAGARHKDSKKCGYINKRGKYIIKPKYHECKVFEKNYALVGADYTGFRQGLINIKGEEVIPLEFRYIIKMKDNFWVASKNKLFGFALYNGNGEKLTEHNLRYLKANADGKGFTGETRDYVIKIDESGNILNKKFIEYSERNVRKSFFED